MIESNMVFRPGHSGNPGGRRKERLWAAAIERAVDRADAIGKRPRLDDIADKLIESALAGSMHAIKEIGDRLDGKAVQAQEIDLTKENQYDDVPTSTINMLIESLNKSLEDDLRRDGTLPTQDNIA